MKKEDLFDTFGDIDRQYVEEAHATGKKKHSFAWAKWGTIAACLAVVVLCASLVNKNAAPPQGENQANDGGMQNEVENFPKQENLSGDLEEAEQDALAEEGWLTEAEVKKMNADTSSLMGICVSSQIGYKGGLYWTSDCDTANLHFKEETEEKIVLNDTWEVTFYRVKELEDGIALFVNQGFCVYEKLEDVIFYIDGVQYGIQYIPVMNVEYKCGEKIMADDRISVYEAVSLPDNQVQEEKYLVDISNIWKEKFPTLYEEGVNYSEYWYIATPVEKS